MSSVSDVHTHWSKSGRSHFGSGPIRRTNIYILRGCSVSRNNRLTRTNMLETFSEKWERAQRSWGEPLLPVISSTRPAWSLMIWRGFSLDAHSDLLDTRIRSSDPLSEPILVCRDSGVEVTVPGLTCVLEGEGIDGTGPTHSQNQTQQNPSGSPRTVAPRSGAKT